MIKRIKYYLTVLILEVYVGGRISQDLAKSLGHKLKLRGFHYG